MSIEQTGHSTTGTVSGDQQRTAGSVWIFLEDVSQSRRDRSDHSFGDFQKSGVAWILVIQKASSRRRSRLEVDAPVSETQCARSTDGEDDGLFVVTGHALHDHSLGTSATISRDVMALFCSRRR